MTLIKNSNLVRQTIDFSGVQNKNMHPSDIDAVLEFDDQVLILMEIKFKGSPIPTGQKLMLQRIADAWHVGVKKAIVLKIEHNFMVHNKDIPLDKCFVTAFYYNGAWKNLKRKQRFVTYLNQLGKLFNTEKCRF